MTNTAKAENRIAQKLNISKMPLNTTQFFELTKEQDWVEKLLLELNEKADSKKASEFLQETHLNIELELTKCFKHEYGEYLLVKGSIDTAFKTSCVRTLDEMDDSLSIEFNSAFLHNRFESDEAFSEQLEIFEKDEIYELYFYAKGHADLAEMIHEVIYLNINQYPIKDESAPLHWANGENDTKH